MLVAGVAAAVRFVLLGSDRSLGARNRISLSKEEDDDLENIGERACFFS